MSLDKYVGKYDRSKLNICIAVMQNKKCINKYDYVF